MSWLWFSCAAIAGLAAGFFAGASSGVSSMQPAIQQLSRGLANDCDFLLRVLRRELANWMFRRDPDRYLRIYREAHEAAAAIAAADRSDQQAQLAKLCKQYPLYADFDLVTSREHVLYADALSMCSYDGVERHFTNIIRFQALKFALDEDWREILRNSATSGDDLAHLEDYVHQFKDTRFKNRLKDAIREFYAYQRGKYDALGLGLPHEEPPYETAAFSVRWVPHIFETRYGVHFKDTDEFGLYTIFFHHDDREPDKEPWVQLYRSNASFDEETWLSNDLPNSSVSTAIKAGRSDASRALQSIFANASPLDTTDTLNEIGARLAKLPSGSPEAAAIRKAYNFLAPETDVGGGQTMRVPVTDAETLAYLMRAIDGMIKFGDPTKYLEELAALGGEEAPM